ncbi:TPA: hypothetical protein EYN98_08755 [Candidatus Poribacteria bacterium]|nr:hypothetical protein [Candidatus Poribacteria bacterium]HIB91767.1 hypothetical protein [Candidatus Poribacteria bacterium]HIN27276.1 hypothetical protein [Candidatus Poribacteria bacterium]HIO06349.1 hypothetical protein [Candidatus Poribacteria bacterium]HIO80670.1 hypothetical protein [Candidatus Poribacteria bacterium]
MEKSTSKRSFLLVIFGLTAIVLIVSIILPMRDLLDLGKKMPGMPMNATAHGVLKSGVHETDNLIYLTHILMFVLGIGWGIFLIYTLLRFRQSKNPIASYAGVRSHLSSYLEIGVAVIEGVLLIGISLPFWSQQLVDANVKSDEDPLVVRVLAEQFAWNFHYPGPDGKFGRIVNPKTVKGNKGFYRDNPVGLDLSDPNARDDITTINQLHLSVNKPVIAQLMSKDVIHAFSLPVMRVKQDAIPGIQIPVYFEPSKSSYDRVSITDFTVTPKEDQKEDQIFVITVGPEHIKDFYGRGEIGQEASPPPEKDFYGILGRAAKVLFTGSELGQRGQELIVKNINLENGTFEVSSPKDLIGSKIVKISRPWEVACAQLCGIGHYLMRADMVVHPEGEFEKWMAKKVAESEEDE